MLGEEGRYELAADGRLEDYRSCEADALHKCGRERVSEACTGEERGGLPMGESEDLHDATLEEGASATRRRSTLLTNKQTGLNYAGFTLSSESKDWHRLVATVMRAMRPTPSLSNQLITAEAAMVFLAPSPAAHRGFS